MKIVSEIKNQQEFEEMKMVLKIFIVNDRIKQLAEMA